MAGIKEKLALPDSKVPFSVLRGVYPAVPRNRHARARSWEAKLRKDGGKKIKRRKKNKKGERERKKSKLKEKKNKNKKLEEKAPGQKASVLKLISSDWVCRALAVAEGPQSSPCSGMSHSGTAAAFQPFLRSPRTLS